jgi:hypothetical protein
MVLVVPEELEIGAVLAIQLPHALDGPGSVVVGRVDRVALGENKNWLVGCALRRPLSDEVVGKTPTLFAVLCASDEPGS